ncbi:MAG TPA: ATP-binding protein [Terriglobales bacterium]|jgi:signal transduction histidine kinase|nr:ATP-binding protein [Terriglobales bacterium]
MVRVRLRTKFLLSMVLVSAGLTSLSLLLVRHTVQAKVVDEIYSDLQNSVTTFQSFQHEQELTLSRFADLLADLTNTRALMTTHDETTIQDGSEGIWRLAGSDLFVLADPTAKIVALHTNTEGFTREMAQSSLSALLQRRERWWFGANHLYEVFVKPIYFGPAADNRLLGFLVIGYEIDSRVASQIGRIANSKVAFSYNGAVVITTLPADLNPQFASQDFSAESGKARALELGKERFLQTTVDLTPGGQPNVRLTVLKSYDEATRFLQKLNRLLLGLGILAVVLGTVLVFLISDTFTRPLSSLLAGVAALEKGDFRYPLKTEGKDEAAELSRAFDAMRESLLKTQQSLLESERLATIGRMANSISHDLRHSLAAIVANAEFLSERDLPQEQREELYQEVQLGVHRMTELIDSLLEFSRTRASLRPTYGNLRMAVERAAQAVRSNPEFHNTQIEIRQRGSLEGWFDHRKLERIFFNLLLNACEAMPDRSGRIMIELDDDGSRIEIQVSDNGRGIPPSIRTTLFEPFVSQGKENGTGLGLTVVQKILQDHGGDISLERTSAQGTVFCIILPHPATLSKGSDVQEASSAKTHAGSAKLA